MLNEFTGLETLNISVQKPSQLWQTRGSKLEDFRNEYGGVTIDFVASVEAWEMVRDAVSGWNIPAVRLVTAYNTSSARNT